MDLIGGFHHVGFLVWLVGLESFRQENGLYSDTYLVLLNEKDKDLIAIISVIYTKTTLIG